MQILLIIWIIYIPDMGVGILRMDNLLGLKTLAVRNNPLIISAEELFRKGKEKLNLQSRQFHRILETFADLSMKDCSSFP